MPRLAIVGPKFFGYTEAIAAEFERRGFSVSIFDEKQSNSVCSKALYRLGARPASQRSHLQSVARSILESGATDVLLVGVEVIDRAFVASLSGLRVHLYQWDGQANKGGFRDYLDLLTSAATFDPHDADGLGLAYIPLFAEPVFDRANLPNYDVAFCGTLHTARVAAVKQLLASDLRVGLLAYYHSRALFAAKAPHSLGLLPRISTVPAPKAKVAELFASSRYVLDIPHPGQAGLTARTFEALLSGARLLTANPEAVDLLPPSLRHRIERFASVPRAADRLQPLTDNERYFLSLRRFGDELQRQMFPERIALAA